MSEKMTTPTPITDAVETKHGLAWFGLHDEQGRYLDGMVKFRELSRQLERDLAAREGELAVERERAEKSEGEVERLLLESEAAHAHITALRDDRRKWEQHYHDERALHGLTLERIEALKQRAEAAEARADEARKAIDLARRAMSGEGVEDQGQAWDKCLRILDAADRSEGGGVTEKRVKAWAVAAEDDGQFMYDIHGQALIYHANRHPDESVFTHTDEGERVVPVEIVYKEGK